MIKVNFDSYDNYLTDSVYQWDINRVLKITGLNLTVAPEVHFTTRQMDKAIVRQSELIDHVVTVNIPNSILQTPYTVYAYIGIYEGSAFKTIETVEIPIIAKARPEDYRIEKSDNEVYSFEALRNNIANMVKLSEYNAHNALIQARIDTIIANSNNTENNSELVDMRIAYDGKTYTATGGAIRNQFIDLINTLTRSGLYSEMVLTGETKKDTYVVKNSGYISESTNSTRGVVIYDISDYVGKILQIRTIANSNTMYAWAFANSDGQVLEIVNGKTEYNDFIYVPDEAHTLYVNFAMSEVEKNNVVVKVIDTLYLPDKFEKSDADLLTINNKIDTLVKDGILRLYMSWEMGGISTTGEIYSPDNIRIRTRYYYNSPFDSVSYNVPDGYRMLAVFYTYSEDTQEYTYSRHRGYVTGSGEFDINEGEFIRFVLRGIDDAITFTGDEHELLTLYHKSNTLLNYEDAKALLRTYEKYPVPDYWQTTIATKEREIKNIIFSNVKSNNDTAVFFAIADPHYPDNTEVSTALMRYLSQKCGIGLTVCLGDIIADSPNSRDDGLSRLRNGIDNLNASADRFLITQGNHDTNVQINDSSGSISADRIIYDKEWILHTSNRLLTQPKIVFDDLGKAFYYDDTILKIRFISLDSFEDKTYTINNGKLTSLHLGRTTNRQIEWLKNTALSNIPDGYSVITFSHLSPIDPKVLVDGEWKNLNAGKMGNADNVAIALREFINNGGDYICHLAGHLHHDFITIDDNIVNVNVLNDGIHWREASYFGGYASAVGDSPIKINGTVNECAFDVVIVNKTTRHVDLIRIGAGDNRSFDY